MMLQGSVPCSLGARECERTAEVKMLTARLIQEAAPPSPFTGAEGREGGWVCSPDTLEVKMTLLSCPPDQMLPLSCGCPV